MSVSSPIAGAIGSLFLHIKMSQSCMVGCFCAQPSASTLVMTPHSHFTLGPLMTMSTLTSMQIHEIIGTLCGACGIKSDAIDFPQTHAVCLFVSLLGNLFSISKQNKQVVT